MKLSARHSIAAPPDRVYAALLDPAVLEKSISGCEKVLTTAAGVYEVHLKLGVAAIKGSYKGTVRVEDPKPYESFRLVLSGRGVPGFVEAKVSIHLRAATTGTDLSAETEARVGGLIAAVGSRLLEVVAKKMSTDFFSRLSQEIER